MRLCIWELSLLSWAPGILWLRLPIVRAGICWWAFWICWSALFLWRDLGVTAASLPIIFALWCMAVGAVQIVSAFQLRNSGVSWRWTLTAGILGVLFAFLILAYPAIGTITLTALMGAYIR